MTAVRRLSLQSCIINTIEIIFYVNLYIYLEFSCSITSVQSSPQRPGFEPSPTHDPLLHVLLSPPRLSYQSLTVSVSVSVSI